MKTNKQCKYCEGEGMQVRNDGVKIECPECMGDITEEVEDM